MHMYQSYQNTLIARLDLLKTEARKYVYDENDNGFSNCIHSIINIRASNTLPSYSQQKSPLECYHSFWSRLLKNISKYRIDYWIYILDYARDGNLSINPLDAITFRNSPKSADSYEYPTYTSSF